MRGKLLRISAVALVALVAALLPFFGSHGDASYAKFRGGGVLSGPTAVFTDGTTITGNGTQASPLVAVGAAQTAVYFNVKSYGAVGDGVTDDSVAIRSAITAAQAAGGVVYFPNGTYLISEKNSTQRCIEIGSHVALLGQSHQAILKLKNGVTNAHMVRMLYTLSGSTDIEIRRLTLDGNQANNPDPAIQSDGMFLSSGTSRVIIRDVEIHDAPADGMTIHQNVTDVDVEDCYLHNNGWMGIGLGNAGGQQRVNIRHNRVIGNLGGIHIEAATPVDSIVFDGNWVDAVMGNASIEVTGGVGAANWVSNVTVRDNTLSGWLEVASAQHVLVTGNKIINPDNTSANLPHHRSAVRVIGDGTDITIQGNTIVETTGSSALEAVIIAGNTNNDLDNVRVLDNHIMSLGTAGQDGVYVQQASAVVIERNKIVGSSAELAGFYGVDINAKLSPNIGSIIVDDNYIADFQIGVIAQGGSGLKVNNLDVSRNRFESITPNLMTSAMSLDLDSHHVVQAATAIGNDIISGSVPTLFSTYPNVPMLIGGSRGGVGDWSGIGAPTLVATQGSTYRRRDGGAGTSFYVNENGVSVWTAK